MRLLTTRRGFIVAGLMTPVLAGCGGGSGSAPGQGSDSRSLGDLSLSLTFFPINRSARARVTREFGGNIPIGTGSVMVSVVDTASGAALAPPKLVAAPSGSTALSPTIVNVQFSAIPVGSVTVKAVAYPDVAAQQNPLANGSASAQITTGTTAMATVMFTLTVSSLTAMPATIHIGPAAGSTQSLPVTAAATDASGRALQLPLFWLSRDPNIAQVTFDPNAPTSATITAVGLGSTVVTVVEPNSGLTASVTVDSTNP